MTWRFCLHKHLLWIDITAFDDPARTLLGACGGIKMEPFDALETSEERP